MMDDLEHVLRDELAALAARAPEPGDLVGAVRRRVRRRRLGVGSASMAVVALVTTAALAHGPALPPVTDGSGDVPVGGAGSCAVMYSAGELVKSDFAFDGTVTKLGPPVSGGSGMPYVGVTFQVHRWYAGGSGTSVTVDLLAPATVGVGVEEATSYGIGTRLLVAGAARWGGAPLDHPVAWGCGFTRYWDEQTATAWAAAFG